VLRAFRERFWLELIELAHARGRSYRAGFAPATNFVMKIQISKREVANSELRSPNLEFILRAVR
jgi:hypothetical protein